MSGRTTCLDAAEVRRLLAGTLAEEEEGRLAAHLDGCPGCRLVLDQAAGGPPQTGAVTRIDDALRRAMNSLKADNRLLTRSVAVQRQEDTLALAGPTGEELPRPRLGHYQMTEIIGRGGFGVVFKAFDPALHRFVAVKVLAPQLASSAAARRRFAREGRAAAAVSHEHVVAIHCVEEADGLPYLVMEYVAGISLQERLDRDGVLGLKEVLRIGMQIAAGLAAAHAQGLVHRDIKPANILSASWDQTVRLWNPATGEQKAVLRGHTDAVRFVAGSPDGRTLASGSFDGSVRLWDPDKWTQRRLLLSEPYKVNCVAFSPDGSVLATAESPLRQTMAQPGKPITFAGQVRLWDVASGEERAILHGVTGKVHAVAFTPDGQGLVSGGGAWGKFGELALWDPVRRELRTLLAHDEWLEYVAFAPDGRTLVSGGGWRGDCSELRVWDVNPPAETTRPAAPWPVRAPPPAVRFGTAPPLPAPENQRCLPSWSPWRCC
jgi:protein kinase-like protein/WD40 domain-containing protein/putative zinc finger protein